MAKGNKKIFNRKRKRTNQHLHNKSVICSDDKQNKEVEIDISNTVDDVDFSSDTESESSQSDVEENNNVDKFDYFILINFKIFKTVIEKFGKCFTCNKNIQVIDNLKS